MGYLIQSLAISLLPCLAGKIASGALKNLHQHLSLRWINFVRRNLLRETGEGHL